jgi:hypothetical protein
MKLEETVPIRPKSQPLGLGANQTVTTDPLSHDTIITDGPIMFHPEPSSLQLPSNIARTQHGDEQMIAELALIKPGADAKGLVLGLKLRMSPRDHVGPQQLLLPVCVLPEGAAIFDKRNAKWVNAVVDLGEIYAEPTPVAPLVTT